MDLSVCVFLYVCVCVCKVINIKQMLLSIKQTKMFGVKIQNFVEEM